MEKKIFTLILILLLVSVSGESNKSFGVITITPHIDEEWERVTHEYTIIGEKGENSFVTYIVADTLYNLKVTDGSTNLDFAIKNPIIFGKRRYLPIEIYFKKPLKKGETQKIFIEFDRQTYATGTRISGEYWYYVKKSVDEVRVVYKIPLKDIEVFGSPPPIKIERGDYTVVKYKVTEDFLKITTRYTKGINFDDIKSTEEVIRVDNVEYKFILNYPKDAELLAEDVRFFIYKMFPDLVRSVGIPLPKKTFVINLKSQGEEDWWAAVNRGYSIDVFIMAPHSYPSTILPHEFTHSYINNIPTFVNEGLADYFSSIILQKYSKHPLKNPNYFLEEWYFETYERQYQEVVDVMSLGYGESDTEKEEALIYAKYNKGLYMITEISKNAGHETVQEIVKIIVEKNKEQPQGLISMDYIVSKLSKNKTEVYEVLTKFGFELKDPRKEEVTEILENTRKDSWFAALLILIKGYDEKVETVSLDEMSQLKREIEETRKFAEKTVIFADFGLLVLFLMFGFFVLKFFVNLSRKKEILSSKKVSRDIDAVKLKLIERFGSMFAYQAEIATKYGWDKVDDEEVLLKFAESLGILED